MLQKLKLQDSSAYINGFLRHNTVQPIKVYQSL